MKENTNDSHKFINYHTIKILMILLILIILVFTIYKMYFAPGPTEIIFDPNKNYTYDIKDNTLYLLSEEGVEQSYKCLNECVFYSDVDLEYKNNGIVLLKDKEDIYLFDLIKNKKISENYLDIKYILDAENNIKLFKVTNKNKKEGIIDLNGTILVNLNYENLGKLHNDEFINYTFADKLIAARNSKAWGAVSLENGAGLIDFQYEDIKISPFNKIAVKELEKWYLVDNYNKRLIFDAYEGIFIFNKYTVVILDKELYLLDQKEEIISNKLQVYSEIDPWGSSEISGAKPYIEEDILYVLIDVPLEDKKDEFEKVKYYYDIEEKELKLYE